MPFNDVYRRQVELLVRTLPYVAEEECFALKYFRHFRDHMSRDQRIQADIA